MDILVKILKESWAITAEMSPYLLFGFFMAGIVKLFLNDKTILKFLGKGNKYSTFFAALLGVPMPLCSCGVVPVAASLKKSGASKGAVASFLLSTPQTGIDSIFATYSLMGWAFAVWRPIQSFLMGIIGGSIINLLDRDFENDEIPEIKSCCQGEKISENVRKEENCPHCAEKENVKEESCPHCVKQEEIKEEPAKESSSCCMAKEETCPHCVEQETDFALEEICPDCKTDLSNSISLKDKVKDVLYHAFVVMPSDLGRPMLLGLLLSGIISAFISPDSLTNSFGGLVGQIGIALLVGIPLYVCSTASIPIAFAMINAGFAPGAALVFLVTGPETNMAGLTVTSKILGAKSFAIYLGTVIILACLAGFLLNDFLTFSNTNNLHHQHEEISIWHHICGGILLLMLVYFSFFKNKKKNISCA